MSMPIDISKVLVITGPTASGKSSLAIALAQKYDGEIVSADSRQIYRGMDIGTGKVECDLLTCHCEGTEAIPDLSDETAALRSQRPYISEGIVHHLIDIREPSKDYNVTDFKRDAKYLIQDIRNRGKLPIVCGGTTFWIQALVDDQIFPAVTPNPKLREELSHVSCEELFERLKTLDPKRAETIDPKNAFRLIRALEIVEALGTVPVFASKAKQSLNISDNNMDIGTAALRSQRQFQIIALNPPKEILDVKIRKRLDERFDQGMIEEVQGLHDKGVSWERLESFGLEYRWIALFLQEKVAENEMREKLFFDIVHYAKRQKTWLRRWKKQGADIRQV